MKKGFTMIELIFVIVILGILAAVAIPKLAATRGDAEIGKNCVIGETLAGCKPGEWKISVIAPEYKLKADSVVAANEMIG